VPTHPGFAGTVIPEHFDALEDLVYLYLDLCDALDLHEVILLGCAMGGWVAAEMAVRNTSRLARLILVDAVGIKPGDRDTRDIADIFGAPTTEVMQRVFHDPTRAPQPLSMTEAEVAVLAGDRIAHAVYTWEPYMHNPKLPQRLHRITVPTLLLWGASDGVVSVAYGEAYQQMIPGATLAVIPEAGHVPHIEQPAMVLQHILAFADQ
jgi:pimeloyl-ACP methyl ester carboxylesterase